MKWFTGRSEAPDREPEQPVRQTSLGLKALINRLDPERKYNLLDLGPACGQNVDFFSQFSGKIYIADLHRTLNSFDYLSPEDGISFESVFHYLLPYEKATRFDVILVWDLFNYLERREFIHLIRHLSHFCATGTLILAHISTRKSIPDRPLAYRVIDQQTLSCGLSTSVMCQCPRYQETDLRLMMPGFRVRNSFLLRNGFKEYLFNFVRPSR